MISGDALVRIPGDSAWKRFLTIKNRVRRSLFGSASACCVQQAGVQFSARHHMKVSPTVLISDEKI